MARPLSTQRYLSNPPKPGDEFVRFLYGRIWCLAQQHTVAEIVKNGLHTLKHVRILLSTSYKIIPFERTFVSICIFRENIVIRNCYWHYYLYFIFKGSFIYDIHKKEGEVSQNFGQFCKWFQMILGERVFFWLVRSTPPNSNPIFSIMYCFLRIVYILLFQ